MTTCVNQSRVSEAENGAERAENRVSGSGALSGRLRSGEPAKSAGQPLTPNISLI